MSSQSAELPELERFEAFCGELKVEDGSPFRLWPFQKTILSDFFAGVVETLIILPKKNGKSTLIAALALFHLITTPDADCIVVAASRDQAEIILRQARMFVRRCADLQKFLVLKQREIVSTLDEGRIRVLAADADTADGVIPTLAIVDELHRHRTSELYAVLRMGIGPRDGQMVTISTAGSSTDSPLGKMRDEAHKWPSFRREGKYNYATTDIKAFHEYCLDPDDDVGNLELVKEVNPAPWKTIGMLRGIKDSVTPWEWLRFQCGIWTHSEEPWISPESWDPLKSDLELPEKVWLGVKRTLGISAIVLVGYQDKRLVTRCELLPKALAGDLVERLRRIHGERNIQAIGFEPRAFKPVAEMLEGEGMELVEFPQTLERMAQASARLYDLITSETLAHDGSVEFRAQVLAGMARKSEREWRVAEDPNSPGSAVALIALAIASVLAETAEETKTYWVI